MQTARLRLCSLLDLVAPSSLLRYSPSSSMRVISFKLPSLKPIPTNSASIARPARMEMLDQTYASRFSEQWRWPRSYSGHSPADIAGYLTCSRLTPGSKQYGMSMSISESSVYRRQTLLAGGVETAETGPEDLDVAEGMGREEKLSRFDSHHIHAHARCTTAQ